MLTVLITGANRGLGLEFTRQYLVLGSRVYAICRKESSAGLDELVAKYTQTLEVMFCDVSDLTNIDVLKHQMGGTPIDVLICNAGVLHPCGKADSLTNSDFDRYLKTFKINVVAPLKLAATFMKNVTASSRKCMAFLTSKMGSISDNTSGGHYFYRASKAALNAECQSLAKDYPGITILLLHPGWVRTRMGGSNGLIDENESVTGLIKIIEEEQRSGIFIDYKGDVIPW